MTCCGAYVRLWPIADITKADVPGCNAHVCFLGVKQTWAIALQMSAYDPKRTLADPHYGFFSICYAVTTNGVLALGTATCAGEISSKLLSDRRSRARIWRWRSKTHE